MPCQLGTYQQVMQHHQRREVLFVKYLVDRVQFFGGVMRPIERFGGPRHEIPLQRLVLRQADRAMLDDVAEGQQGTA